MSILIRFEDSYGCRSLFNHSNSILKSYDINYSLCNTGIFKISKRLVDNYDYIICVFDLDSFDGKSFALTSDVLRSQLKKYFYSENSIKPCFRNKIILIPVYFCYETMTLYSSYIKNILSSLDDYSKLSPELLFDYKSNVIKIVTSINKVLNNKTTKTWYPQVFYKSYSKSVLKLLSISFGFCVDDTLYNKLGDNLFDKNEDVLYDWFNLKGLNDFTDSIIIGLENSYYNRFFYKILTLDDLNELENLVLEENLQYIYSDLDRYNKDLVKSSEYVKDLASYFREYVYKYNE